MKIKCDKCGKDITMQCDMNIESYIVGKIKCPHCNTYQKRYISEADVMLFFAISEVMYTLFTYITVIVFNNSFNWWYILIMFAVFVLYYLMSKSLASYIYLNAPFKKDIKNKEFDEDAQQIKKSFTWQFMLFFVIAISGMSLDQGSNEFFLRILPVIPLLSFIKFYFQLKYEKKK